MKLTFLPGSSDGPVLLFAQADPRGARLLKAAFDVLVGCEHASVELHMLPGIETEPGVELTAATGPRGHVPRAAVGRGFVWSLTPDEWETVAGLVETFIDPDGRPFHQILGQAGSTTVVISTTDHW